jgi:TonB family protein
MNRLQKKCIIFSVSLHVMLVGILLFGSAFLNSEPKAESPPLLTAFDPNMINNLLTKGGNPNVQVAPPTSLPQSKPVEIPKPADPPKVKREATEKVDPPEPVKKIKSSDEEPKPKKRETLSDDELKLTKPSVSKPVKRRDDSDSKAKEYADARRAAQDVDRAVRNLSNKLSTSTAVELPNPYGTGGPLSASYRDLVASTYNAAWSSPPGLNDDSAKVTVTVTIARDGRVVMGRIKRPSGNSAMDESIQNMLDTVTRMPAPFPEGSTDPERTFVITLSLLAKR